MRSVLISLVLGAFLALAACGRDRTQAAVGLVGAGDYNAALASLEAARGEAPDDLAVRYLLFVIYKHLAIHGAAADQAGYQDKAIVEYDVIVKAEGIPPDYREMEKSLKAKPESARRLAQARRPVYGDG